MTLSGPFTPFQHLYTLHTLFNAFWLYLYLDFSVSDSCFQPAKVGKEVYKYKGTSTVKYCLCLYILFCSLSSLSVQLRRKIDGQRDTV